MEKQDKSSFHKLFKIVPSEVHILGNTQMNSMKPTNLLITNISGNSIVLKIKINSIHSYNVKPCSGILKPNEELNVEITAHCNDTIENINKTHKFLIHAKVINEKEFNHNPTEILKNFDEIISTENYRKRIGVRFEIIKIPIIPQDHNIKPSFQGNEDNQNNP